jgi:twitching motility protein PilT
MATEAPASYIDTLLKRVASRGATLGVRFETGAPVRVTDGNGFARDVTNRMLSTQEIMSAISPMIPETIKRLPQQPTVAFNYECDGVGAFDVLIRRDGQQLWVSIDPGSEPDAAEEPAPAEPELIIETTSVSAVIDANRDVVPDAPAPVEADDDPVLEVVMTPDEPDVIAAAPVAPEARVAPVAPVAPISAAPEASASAAPEASASAAPEASASAAPEASASAAPVAPAAAAAPSGAHVGTAAIDRLFHLMCEARASDLHLSVGMPPLVRKDGEIKLLEENAPVLDRASMWALLEPIMPERNKEEFERRHDSDFAYEIAGLGRFRSNVFMDRKGPGAVFRVIPSKILTAENLGLSSHILKLCQLSKGLVLVTGPTGSGKSTTLCAMIDYINRTRRDHIITIEDPIEFVHENKQCLMNQREVHVHTDGFKDALRAALREDPDIVLVGEMRDLETVAIAIETAETGHLVFGTLHTTTAASTVDRVIDQFPTDRQAQIRIMLSESLKGVIAQNLCKKIGGGRAAALEVLIVTSAVSNLIREAKTFQIPSIMQVGKSVGMVGLNDALMDLVAKKVVAPEEAYTKAVDKTGFEALLKRAGIDTKFVTPAKEG